jgi:hypothetical protein
MSSEHEYTPEQFVSEVAKGAVDAIHRRVPRMLVGTLYTQFAVETGWGETLAINPYNFAGISRQGQLLRFATLGDFVDRYCAVIAYPYYAAILENVTVPGQLRALGESPWSAAHYTEPGEPAGTTLLNVWHDDIEPVLAPADQEAAADAAHEKAPADAAHYTAPAEIAVAEDAVHGGITPDPDAPTPQQESADVALFERLGIIPTVLQVRDSKTEMQCLYAGLAALAQAGAPSDQMAWYLMQCYGFSPYFADQFAQSVKDTGKIFGTELPAVPAAGWDFTKATPEVAIS